MWNLVLCAALMSGCKSPTDMCVNINGLCLKPGRTSECFIFKNGLRQPMVNYIGLNHFLHEVFHRSQHTVHFWRFYAEWTYVWENITIFFPAKFVNFVWWEYLYMDIVHIRVSCLCKWGLKVLLTTWLNIISYYLFKI